MIDVLVSGPPEEGERIIETGNRLQSRFRFSNTLGAPAARLQIEPGFAAAPFLVHRDNGVVVSTYQSDGICQYAATSRDLYLLVCSLLGLVQWRALELNPLLVWEDFFVREDPAGCLYARRATVQEYALAFEDPYVCGACLEFLRCLGAEQETCALQQVLHSAGQLH